MSELIKQETGELATQEPKDIVAMSQELIIEARNEMIPKGKSISMPIGKLSTLGAAVSSLIPALNTVTQTATVNTTGLYKFVGEGVLKQAKDGTFWGASKTAAGVSKMGKFQAVDPMKVTSAATYINPAMVMMAVALFSIEQELGEIKEMEKQILTFLQVEKEAQIEADVVTLNEIINKYKHNWNNDQFVTSNHKMVCDIQRTARKNMISYEKLVAEALKQKKLIIAQGQVNIELKELLKKFKYYRLSLYSFAMASFLEIMLSGNFKEANISASSKEVRKYTDEYRKLFSDCSLFLEKSSKGSIETNILKGLGTATDAIGRFIGSIPKVSDGQVDEFLQEKGGKILQTSEKISKDTIESFATVSNPNTSIFLNKMDDMIRIYDRTTEICFDKDNIYLVEA